MHMHHNGLMSNPSLKRRTSQSMTVTATATVTGTATGTETGGGGGISTNSGIEIVAPHVVNPSSIITNNNMKYTPKLWISVQI